MTDAGDVAGAAAGAGCMLAGCVWQVIMAAATIIGLMVLASWCFG